MLCMINAYAQQDSNTNVSGDDAGWDDEATDSVNTIVKPIQIESDISAIYDLTGKKVETDDINTLPPGIYILNRRKFMVQ